MVSISFSPTLFVERRSEGLQVSFVDGYENRKLFCVAALASDNSEAKTTALWNFILEKNIQVIIMADFNEVSSKQCEYVFVHFYDFVLNSKWFFATFIASSKLN